MERIKIEGNRLLAGSEEIILRGVAVEDPYRIRLKDHSILEILGRIKSYGFNALRIPILPGNYETMHKFLKFAVRPFVEAASELGMYAMLDWHAIGNPVEGETRRPEDYHIVGNTKVYWHDASFEAAKEGWNSISEYFKDYDNVIFELFNEPAPGEDESESPGNSKPLPWKKWKEKAEELISIIRNNSNHAIIVGGNKWTMGLEHVMQDPILKENIAYSAHPYAVHKNWKMLLPSFKEKLPLLITEWAFDEDSKEKIFMATPENYGIPLIKMCAEHNIGWFAWCYSPVWGPRMLKSWDTLELTRWGEFITKNINIQ